MWNIENCLYKVLVLIRNVCKVGQMHRRRRSREQSIFQLACLSHYSIYKHCDFNKTWKRELLNREIYLRQHQRTNSFYYYQQGKSLDWGWNWNFYVGSNKSVSINKLLVTCLWLETIALHQSDGGVTTVVLTWNFSGIVTNLLACPKFQETINSLLKIHKVSWKLLSMILYCYIICTA